MGHEETNGFCLGFLEGLFHPCEKPESHEEGTHKISGQLQPVYTPTYPRPKATHPNEVPR